MLSSVGVSNCGRPGTSEECVKQSVEDLSVQYTNTQKYTTASTIDMSHIVSTISERSVHVTSATRVITMVRGVRLLVYCVLLVFGSHISARSGATATTRTIQLECCFVSQPLKHTTAVMTQAKQTQSDRCTFQDGLEYRARGARGCVMQGS